MIGQPTDVSHIDVSLSPFPSLQKQWGEEEEEGEGEGEEEEEEYT